MYGIVQTPAGKAAANTEVTLIPETYNPWFRDRSDVKLYRDTTDGEGMYAIENVAAGTYNLEAVHLSSGTRMTMWNIERSKADSQEVELISLRPPVNIRIHMPEATVSEKGYVYIPGTTVFTGFPAGASMVTLDPVSAGIIPEILYASQREALKIALLTENVEVDPEQEVFVSVYTLWKHSARGNINTSASGADVSEDLVNIPVLIRLNSSSSSSSSIFETAMTNGEDIRFAKADDTPLAYEIERWDRANERAEIWVRVDTVFGGSSTQNITMYWGREGAPDESDAQAVFTEEAGFAGVWHLAESGNEERDGYRDATDLENHGTGYGLSAASGVEGMIGGAQELDGISNYIKVQDNVSLNFGTGDFTVSAFIRANIVDTQRQIFSKRAYEGNYELQIHNPEFLRAYVRDTSGRDSLDSRTPVSAQAWYYVALKRQEGALLMYINGVQEPDTMMTKKDVSSPADFYIGVDGKQLIDSTGWKEYFDGIIDEVRMSGVARSEEWIKFCYENQKRNSTVISIKQ